MAATKTPQQAATMTSRRSGLLSGRGADWLMNYIGLIKTNGPFTRVIT